MIKLPAEIDTFCDAGDCEKTAIFLDEESDQYLCEKHAEKLEDLRERLLVIVS